MSSIGESYGLVAVRYAKNLIATRQAPSSVGWEEIASTIFTSNIVQNRDSAALADQSASVAFVFAYSKPKSIKQTQKMLDLAASFSHSE